MDIIKILGKKIWLKLINGVCLMVIILDRWRVILMHITQNQKIREVNGNYGYVLKYNGIQAKVNALSLQVNKKFQKIQIQF